MLSVPSVLVWSHAHAAWAAANPHEPWAHGTSGGVAARVIRTVAPEVFTPNTTLAHAKKPLLVARICCSFGKSFGFDPGHDVSWRPAV